jgi:hypothetical protein
VGARFHYVTHSARMGKCKVKFDQTVSTIQKVG